MADTMDVSQISELASALMDTWASASGAELMANTQNLGVQSSENINKPFPGAVKQEIVSNAREFTEYPGVIPLQSHLPGHAINPATSGQVPMDDFDPLESFAFWDGENFYSQSDFDACAASTCDMQTDSFMPTLEEYVAEDDITQDDAFPIKETDLLNNPTLAELNSCNDPIFDYSIDNTFLADDNSLPLVTDGLSKSFPASESHFAASPVSSSIPNSSSFVGGLNFVPSAYIDIKQNTQPSLSSSCPASSRFMPNSQFLNPCDEKFLLCPQNSPASESFFAQRMESMENKNRIAMNACGIPPSPMNVAHSRLQETNLLSSSAPPDITMATYFPKIKSEPPSHSPGPKSVTERSLSGFSSLSLSNDDESGSFFDSDAEDEFSSDEGNLKLVDYCNI